MKKNENIFISLQIQKDSNSKGLLLSVQFDKNAPNILLDNEAINWCPTRDEIDFIAEAFELMGSNNIQRKVVEEPRDINVPSEEDTTDYSHRSSEIRIAPLPNDMTLEEPEELGSSRLKKKEEDEDSIFIQADEKKIDEILKRKKPVVKDEYATDSGEKTIIDRMLKQKKKK
jgi:hypothetical protein